MLLNALYLLMLLAWAPFSLYATPSQVVIIGFAENDAAYNLDSEGLDRANLLSNYLTSLESQGVPAPEIIFTALRSQDVPGHAVGQTTIPTSALIKQPIHTYPTSNILGLVNRVLTNRSCDNKCVLIVWDLDSIQELIAAFGYEAPACPSHTCHALTYVLNSFPGNGASPSTVLNQELLAGDATCGGIIPPLPPSPQVVADYIPITIYNGTTSAIVNGVSQPITPSQIYIFIQTNGGANVMQFAPDGNGRMLGSPIIPVPTSGNASTYYTSYFSYPLSAFPSAAPGFYTFYLPADIELPSSRIYFSVINPINWQITPTGGVLSQDDNFVTSNNTYYTLYDKIEFTVTHVNNPWWQLVMNSTMVDYYCLPLSFYVNQVVGGVNTTNYTGLSPYFSRQDVFSTYNSSLGTLPGSGAGTWSNLFGAYTPVNGSPSNLRIASANTGALKPTNSSPIFPMSYLSNNPNSSCQWLTTLWNTYYKTGLGNNTITLILTNAGPTAGTATGQVDVNGNFVFTIQNSTLWPSSATVTFQPPVTIAPFFSGAYTDYVDPTNSNAPLWSFSGGANEAAVEAIWQIFSCAFNVGFIPPPAGVGTAGNPLTKSYLQGQQANYFQNNAALCPGPWYNFFSQVLHTMLVQSPYINYYTAPFDDYLGIDGTIFVDDTTGANQGASVNVTLGDMTGSVIPNILNDSTVYSVTINLPGTVSNVTFNGQPVTTSGPVGTATGSNINLSLQYTSGPYANTTFTTQVSPGTATTTPVLPYPAHIVLNGNTVTITLGGAPSPPPV